jgi:hypothetical protein
MNVLGPTINPKTYDSMTAVKVTYIICSLIFDLVLIGLAVASPIWITPGYYWWTGFSIIIMMANSSSFTQRLNTWGDCGNVD